ncbi:class I SAM-dependent methyltransferase [Sunxiuqinia elliptica]
MNKFNEMKGKNNYWSRFALDFEKRNRFVVGRLDAELVAGKVASLENLGSVLELGCGNGTYSKIIAGASHQLLATDLSQEMIDVAKQRLASFSNATAEQADCYNLPYQSHTFDTVFMANLLHVVTHPENLLIESKRVLKHNGLLIVVSFTQDGMRLDHKIGMILRYLKTYGKPPQSRRKLGLQRAVSLLEEQGFYISESQLIGMKTKALFIQAYRR